MQQIPFTKMHGAGNDFIVVDDRAVSFPLQDRTWLTAIATRRTGVGSDGILLVQPSQEADFRMRFFNPDGGEVDMCGNGARCIARFAHSIGAAPENMTIETPAGLLHAEIQDTHVRLHLTDPKDWRLKQELFVDGTPMSYAFVNTGVPHVVLEVADASAADVAGLGRKIRYHADFQPAGTNVNFVQRMDERTLRVRTYERGVEAETLACGTGLTASGLVMARRGRVRLPVLLETAGGDVLEVHAALSRGDGADVTLTGPAVTVYEGTLTYG